MAFSFPMKHSVSQILCMFFSFSKLVLASEFVKMEGKKQFKTILEIVFKHSKYPSQKLESHC